MDFKDKEKIRQLLHTGKMIFANAKINLSIDVLGTRPEDGYHLVKMIMQQIPLYDRMFVFTGSDAKLLPHITMVDQQIGLACNTWRLPLNEKNLVYKAARIMLDAHKIDEPVTIYIEKHIPSGGGLGGGSADGAAILRGMNSIYALGQTLDQLEVLGKKLGSDVPFMVRGGASLAQGTGTELTKLRPMRKGWLLLVNPNLFLSTEKVYKALDEMEIPESAHPDTELLIDALNRQDLETYAKNMKNVLELASFALCPEIKALKEQILMQGAIGAMMSGSGATVFGLFREESQARAAMTYFRGRDYFATVTSL